MTSIESKLDELSADFADLGVRDRLTLLLEIAGELPSLPERYADHPDLLERVEECQSPVYLFVEVNGGLVNIFLTAPEEAPTTRGFASILHQLLDGHTVSEVLNAPEDLPDRLHLREAVSLLRINGLRGMLNRIKRQVREKSA
ncbi:MAG: SufE family protein [Micrococcales bacterium]